MTGELRFLGHVLRPIPGRDTYYASRDGQIWSTRHRGRITTPRPLIPRANKANGQICVSLYVESSHYQRTFASGKVASCVRPISAKVKQLVAAVWLPPRPSPAHSLICK